MNVGANGIEISDVTYDMQDTFDCSLKYYSVHVYSSESSLIARAVNS